jgi:type II secretory pathway pseudopilin PulG
LTAENKESGFVLVEAIAALAVAAFAATALIAALNASSARSAEAKVRGLALRQAEFLIAEIMNAEKLSGLELRGALPASKLTWTRMFKSEATYPNLQHVVVEVSWQNPQKKGTTRLEAYRIAPIETR